MILKQKKTPMNFIFYMKYHGMSILNNFDGNYNQKI
jgi:hypothetical protein